MTRGIQRWISISCASATSYRSIHALLAWLSTKVALPLSMGVRQLYNICSTQWRR
ncbi:MAG: hypothetical protein E6J34_11785 [Chloroflexi bacterium]|nr:MAG: hypothetical protein E6J34_11785 [Chloroflexota bacterium]